MKLWMVVDVGSGEGGGFRVQSKRPHKISLLTKIEKEFLRFIHLTCLLEAIDCHLGKTHYIFSIWALKNS